MVVSLQLAAVAGPGVRLTGVGLASALLRLVVGGVVVALATVLGLNVTVAGPGGGHIDIIVSTELSLWAAPADSSASSQPPSRPRQEPGTASHQHQPRSGLTSPLLSSQL